MFTLIQPYGCISAVSNLEPGAVAHDLAAAKASPMSDGTSCASSVCWCADGQARFDSLYESLPGAVCGTAGPSVAQTRQTGEYVSHALTRPDATWQGRSISS